MSGLEKVKRRAESDAKTRGYYLNPDPEFLDNLLEGLRKNEERYGYPSCPCRLSSGKFHFDRDIICPCDYRDPDVEEHGYCYCALYIRKDVHEDRTPIMPIPERRPVEKYQRTYAKSSNSVAIASDKRRNAGSEETLEGELKMWYCKQCGYVCFREDSPYVCPICKAKREMFARMEILAKVRG